MGNCNGDGRGGCDDDDSGEPNMDTDPATIARVQAKIDRCLYWDGGLPFEKHQATMKAGAKKTCESLAQILRRHPVLGLKVLGYTGELPELEAKTLSQQRTMAVKNALHEAGADNLIAARGMGYADKIGPRIELVPCEGKEVSALMAEIQQAEQKLKLLANGRSCTNERGCTNQCQQQ
mmetsp:Transcript_48677/g.112809  ORF Transcript_48677/g.112809 Transcript_48677/m.112809 type:complete len:178 (-) Transcript_48677:48-581(-)